MRGPSRPGKDDQCCVLSTLRWMYIGVIFKCRIAQIVLVFICCFDCNWCSWIKCKKSTMNQEFPLSTRSRCLERVAPLERRRSPQSCARRNVIGLLIEMLRDLRFAANSLKNCFLKKTFSDSDSQTRKVFFRYQSPGWKGQIFATDSWWYVTQKYIDMIDFDCCL